MSYVTGLHGWFEVFRCFSPRLSEVRTAKLGDELFTLAKVADPPDP